MLYFGDSALVFKNRASYSFVYPDFYQSQVHVSFSPCFKKPAKDKIGVSGQKATLHTRLEHIYCSTWTLISEVCSERLRCNATQCYWHLNTSELHGKDQRALGRTGKARLFLAVTRQARYPWKHKPSQQETKESCRVLIMLTLVAPLQLGTVEYN